MIKGIQISEAVTSSQRRQRLNLFPGRSMSEQAFDYLQDYTEDRLAPLLTGSRPGIVHGLEVSHQQTASGDGMKLPPRPATEAAGFKRSGSQKNTRYGKTAKGSVDAGPRRFAKALSVTPRKLSGGGTRRIDPALNVDLPARSFAERPQPAADFAADELPDKEAPRSDDILRVNPGLAVGPHGEAISLYFPLHVPFASLLLEYRRQNALSRPVSGVFFLTLHRDVARVDASMDVDACRRSEPDPLRDMRLEMVTRLGLQLINASPVLLAQPRLRVANRLLARFTQQSWTKPDSDELPIAMVAVRRNQLLWLDPLAGRYETIADAEYRALLAHTRAAFHTTRPGHRDQRWPRLDFLPAAGQLPSDMLQGLGSDEAPQLLWLPDTIQVDMVPLPASQVDAVIQRELPRGTVRLRPPGRDRLRLMLAIPDRDYRPDLLDLPAADHALEQEVYRRSQTAHESWRQWATQYLRLYHLRKRPDGTDDTTLSERELRALSRPPSIAAPLPASNPDNRDSSALSAQERQQYAIPDPARQAMLLVLDRQGSLAGWRYTNNFSSTGFFDQQIRKRAEMAKVAQLDPLPLPYRYGIPLPPDSYVWHDGTQPPAPETPNDNGLVIQLAETEKFLDTLNKGIETGRRIIDKASDFLLLQRQQLDAQSISFTTLAGGVAGDGSGMQITRWLPQTRWDVAPRAPSDENEETPQVTEDDTALSFSKPLMMNYTPLPSTASTATEETAPLQGALAQGEYLQASPWLSGAWGGFGGNADSPQGDDQQPTQGFVLNDWANVIKTPWLDISSNALLANDASTENLKRVTTPKNPVSSPLFVTANNTFGVLEHVLPVHREYNNAFGGLRDLRDRHTSIYETIKDYIDRLPENPDLAADRVTILALLNERLSTIATQPGTDIKKRAWYLNLEDLKSSNLSPVGENSSGSDGNSNDENDKAIKSRHLFNAGQVLVGDIEELEELLRALRSLFRRLGRLLKESEQRRQRLRKRIDKLQRSLAASDRQRREALSDYALAQRLLMEEWQQVERQYLERRRILQSHQGLFYTRVRETPLSHQLPDPLSLRFGSDSDPVPGCSDTDAMVPDELMPFQEAVMDIPLADWRRLQQHWHLLPGRLRLDGLLQRRAQRMQTRVKLADALEPGLIERSAGRRLQTLYRQNRTVLYQFAQASIAPSRSLAELQRNSSRLLSLEDVLSGPPHHLRKRAEGLRKQLDSAAACLLEQLLKLPPSIRLNWAEEVEENRLRAHLPQTWPLLKQAETDNFDAVRTLVELVQWLFRQLADDASPGSHSAMDNLVRACLLEAASDDPGELLQGRLLLIPGRLRPGISLRLQLNREAQPGMRLQLFDDRQRVVGSVRIEDEDEQGTLAKVVDVWEPDAMLSTRSYAAGFMRLRGK